jgi:ABC-type amino acid transport substrate-binding protein
MKFKFQNFIFFICLFIGFYNHVFAQDFTQIQTQAQAQAAKPIQPVKSSPHINTRINLTAAEAAWLKAHPEISVAVKHGYSPVEFIFELQEFRGISVDYLKKLEAIIGVKFNKRMADQNLAANDADMISSLTNVKSLEGTRFVALDIPFLVSPIGIFTKKTATKFDRIEDLYGKKVAVFKTGFIAQRLAEERPQINLYLVDIAEEALDAVATGKVDAYVGNADIIKYVLKSNENETIVFAANTPYQAEIYMAVRNDWPLFKTILEKGLQAISAQEKAEILHKWTAVTYLSQINYGLIASIVIVSLVILSVF